MVSFFVCSIGCCLVLGASAIDWPIMCLLTHTLCRAALMYCLVGCCTRSSSSIRLSCWAVCCVVSYSAFSFHCIWLAVVVGQKLRVSVESQCWCLCMSLQLSSVKSQLEEQRVRLEKTHSDEMEKLLQNVTYFLVSWHSVMQDFVHV